MAQASDSAKHPEIDFRQTIHVEGIGVVPLWTVGTMDAEPYSVFHIDGNIEDQAQVVFAINKEDQSVYLLRGYIYGHPDSEYDEKIGTDFDFYRSAKSVATSHIPTLLNTGVALISTLQNHEAVKQCPFTPSFYQLDEADEFLREAVLDTLSKDGGVSLLKDSQNATIQITANYPAPDPTLLNIYAPTSPEPEQPKPKTRIEMDYGIPF
ncbi:hypothetical protein [Aeromonas caviae]|uniref:hypothetical protein n=1 Tax=Aeromonas caviae TaxID=648 RepID=UPI003858F021